MQLKACNSSWPHSPQRSLEQPLARMPHITPCGPGTADPIPFAAARYSLTGPVVSPGNAACAACLACACRVRST